MAAIQGRGALIAYRGTGPVVAASANAAQVFGREPMGKTPEDVVGREGLHAVRNTVALPLATTRSVFSGRVGNLDLHAFVDGGFTVIEAEPAGSDRLPDAYSIERDAALIAGAGGEETRASLIRTLSGFDTVEDFAPSELPEELASRPGLYVLDDAARSPVPVEGELPPLSMAGLRLPSEAALRILSDADIAAVTVLRAQRRTLVLKHCQRRMPNHRTRLVLLHLAHLL